MGLYLRRVVLQYPRLGWQVSTGITGSFQSESVATFDWNRRQVSTGISGNFRPEYARGLALGNELMIPVIQVKVAGQLERRRLSRITAITALLVLSEKLDRHRSPHGAPRRPPNKPTGLIRQFLMEESACYLTPNLSEKSAQDAFGARRPADQPPEGARR
jgi:hypothetical protein